MNKYIERDKIRGVIQSQGYDEKLATVISNLLNYMREKKCHGACHDSTSILYIALKELGYEPELCIGEIAYSPYTYPECWADHSWITLDGKIIDLAIALPLGNEVISDPIVLNVNIETKEPYTIKYGVKSEYGLDFPAKAFVNLTIVRYMRMHPIAKNGLMEIVNIILPKEYQTDIDILYDKYENDKRTYVCVHYLK